MPTIQFDDPTQRARLPHLLTPFVGRRRELAELRELLARTRLLTLTGVGGSGKTRLAIECASALEAESRGVCWVELAGLSDAAALPHHVAGILSIRETASASTTAAIVEHLRDSQQLLVLDNCEHVVDECALLVEALLRNCPRLTILATSREAFGIGGERAWLVPPLSLPERASGVSLAEAELAEAIQLFVERASSAASGFVLTTDNVDAVVRICRRVDGIPLAIELAAARVKVLAPREIADRLEQSFGLLTAGGRATVPRHRTLRETIDWSYALLTPPEQALLRRLSVIAGGFRLESVEDICAGGDLSAEDIIDTLASLVDKSLVVVQSGPTFTRYRLLETVRQYAHEKLEASGEREVLRERHAEHFLALAEKAAPHLIGGAGVPYWMDRLLEDVDDLRLVAEWAEESRDRVAVTLRMGAAVQWLLFAQGWFQEGRDRLTHALSIAQDVDPYTRAVGATALAAICLWQGDTAQLSGLIEPVLPILRDAPERSTYAYALGMLGGAISQEGDPVGAEPVLAQAVEAARLQPHPVLLAIALYWRGISARSRGELELARTSFEEAVSIGRAQNNLPSVAHPLTALARVLVQRAQPGDLANAEAMLNEALELHRSTSDRWGLAWVLETLGNISSQAHNAERVTHLLAGAEALRELMGAPRPPAERAEIAALLDDARRSLGRDRFDAIWNEVRTWPLDAVLDYARSTAVARVPGRHAEGKQERAADLDVRALGPLRVISSGEELDVKRLPSKVRELLVFLLCHPEGVTREQVGLALWPDASSTQLRNSFHVTMHRLRKGLADAAWIEVVGERYRILPALRVNFDAHDFEQTVSSSLKALRAGKLADAQLRQAIASYRGDFLAGEKIGDWHLQQRDHLQRLYRDALRALAAHDVSHGRHDDAAALYQRLVAVDDLDEEAWRGLIRCSIAAGDRTGAHRLFERLRARLRDELDADPEPETTALMRNFQISV